MNAFLDRMSAVLETPVTEDTRFREVDGWSSLMAFGMLVVLESEYGRRMGIAEFETLETVGDVARAANVGPLS